MKITRRTISTRSVQSTRRIGVSAQIIASAKADGKQAMQSLIESFTKKANSALNAEGISVAINKDETQIDAHHNNIGYWIEYLISEDGEQLPEDEGGVMSWTFTIVRQKDKGWVPDMESNSDNWDVDDFVNAVKGSISAYSDDSDDSDDLATL